MALLITESQRVFSVRGKLNAATAATLSQHIARFMNSEEPLILNLERVKAMDTSAAHALKQFYLKAIKGNSLVRIIGRENPSIFQVLSANKTSYILSNDRI